MGLALGVFFGFVVAVFLRTSKDLKQTKGAIKMLSGKRLTDGLWVGLAAIGVIVAVALWGGGRL